MIRFIAWFVSLFAIPPSRRERLRRDTLYFLYGIPVRRRAKRIGVRLRCAGPVHVTRKTELGDHVGFRAEAAAAIDGAVGQNEITLFFHSFSP